MQAQIREPGVYAVGYNKILASDTSGWSEPYINFVLARKIMDINENKQFMPNKFVTRADMAYFLYNMNNCQANISYKNKNLILSTIT